MAEQRPGTTPASSLLKFLPRRFGSRTFGFSTRWFAVCLWNGSEGWLQVPLVLLQVGRDHIEVGLGTGPIYVALDLRWRW